LARVVAQMSLLAWWYPDTYELNRMFPNLDHVFCRAEQSMFGFQPSLSFASTFSWAPISELMSMGYAAYYPILVCQVQCGTRSETDWRFWSLLCLGIAQTLRTAKSKQ
jgi:hypothetical protein